MHEPDHAARRSDWISTTLGEVASCTLGGTPSTEVPGFWGGDIPWMASGDVNLRRIHAVPGRITAAGLASSNATLVQPPAVAVGLAGQGKTRGTVALTLCELSTNQSIALLRGDQERLQTEFLFHNLDRRYEELRARSSGGGRGGLSKGILDAVPIDLPPLPEQRVITQVLDTLNTTIRQTEAVIEKLQQVKQGLLHDLLTRGIDANGELRPPQSDAPHLYKESVLGWIPAEWSDLQLSDVVSDSYRYPSYFGIEYVATGVAEIRGELIRDDGRLDDKAESYRYISKATAAKFARVHLAADDIVMTVRGTIGKFAKVPPRLAGAVITANLLKLSLEKAVVLADWLMSELLSRAFQDRLDAACSSTTIKTIQVPELMAIHIGVPQLQEQREVILRLDALDHRRGLELQTLEKLKLQKAGLMDDLLTGVVRVTPLLT